MTEQEKHQIEDLRTTSKGLFVAIVTGITFVVLHFTSEVWFSYHRHQSWSARGSLFTALLWASAWFCVSFLLGFLFGIPKVLQTTPNVEPSNNAGGTGSGNSAQMTAATPRSLRVNTNLEEISDWLTKILVGAGLTQLVRAPEAIRSISLYMAAGMEEGTPTFAAALLVFFSSLGFISGYLLTRMFISLAFARADWGPSFPDTRPLDATSFALGTSTEPSKEAQVVASQLSSVEVTGQLTSPQALAVSKAASMQGNSERALAAAYVAVMKAPENALAHLSLALALHGIGRDTREVMEELDKARALSNIKQNPKIAEDIYSSLMYVCLYLNPPLGYTKAIDLGEEFTSKALPSGPSLWINLACAYAQNYRDLRQRNADATTELQNLRSRTLDCTSKAISLDAASRDLLRQLFHGTGANPTDDDLKVFEADPDFQRVLGEG